MIKPEHLREEVVRPTLVLMEQLWDGINSRAAENLILLTAAQESHMGTYLRQIRGPALGIYQVEPATHHDIWENYLVHRPERASLIRGFMTQRVDFEGNLTWNLQYATAICRLKYWRQRFEWPEDPDDIEALGKIWDDCYNANPEKGTVDEALANYHRFVTDT